MKVFLDFETRSKCDLRKAGAVVYAQHPSTEVLCMSYALDSGEVQRHVPPGEESAFFGYKETFHLILRVGRPNVTYVAHNISFERAILKYVLGIETPLEQWEDTAAIARFQSLPGGLQQLGDFFGQPKDMAGNRVMMQLSKPRKPSKNNPDEWVTREKYPEKYEALYTYCDRDVELLQKFYKALRSMTDYERKTWLLTERMAERGITIDVDSLKLAQQRIDAESERITAKVMRATGGIKTSQRDKIKDWLGLPNMQKATVEAALNTETDPKKRYVLMARQAVGMASVRKLKAMGDRVTTEGTIHHTLIYAGAERTGRWSGRGIQPQNFPRGWGGEKLYKFFDELNSGEDIAQLHDTVSNCLKGFIVGRDSRPLLVGDYSQIECRVLAWLAGQDDLLEVFATGGDPYCVMAETVYGYPIDKKNNPDERQLGKAIILGCGYGMGGPKFATTAYDMYGLEIAEDRGSELVQIYRDKYPNIRSLWYQVEEAFRDCIGKHRVSREVGSLTFRGHKGKHVSIELPSGRRLWYNRARLVFGTSRDTYGKGVIQYYGKNTYTSKYSDSESTYGAKVVENCCGFYTPVLTDKGVVALGQVTTGHRVWDGFNWVQHEGLLDQGVQETIEVDGVRMTPDHKVFTENEVWVNGQEAARHNRYEVRLPDGYKRCRVGRREPRSSMAVSMPGVRGYLRSGGEEFSENGQAGDRNVLWLHEKQKHRREEQTAWHGQSPGLLGMEIDERPLPPTFASGVSQLWRTGGSRLRSMVRVFREPLGRYGADLSTRVRVGPVRQQPRVLSGELPLGNSEAQLEQQTNQHPRRQPLREYDCSSAITDFRGESDYPAIPNRSGGNRFTVDRNARRTEPVYDLKNAGPLHQFTVISVEGPMLVHNCTQGIARDVMAEAMLKIEAAGYLLQLTVHDEVVAEAGNVDPQKDLKEFIRLLEERPTWAQDLPLAVEADLHMRYQK